METSDTNPTGDDRRGPDALIHREILQIGVLILIAVIGFLVTRAVAANNREVTFRDAEAWYERGQRLMIAGRVDEAIASWRRASVRNRFERKYALALAKALERNGDTEAARAALLTLREARPKTPKSTSSWRVSPRGARTSPRRFASTTTRSTLRGRRNLPVTVLKCGSS